MRDIKARNFRKRWLLFSSISFGCLLVVLGTLATFFILKWPLQKVAVANLNPQRNPQANQLKPALEEAIKNYKLIIRYPNGSTKQFSAADMGIGFDIDQTITDAQLQIKNSKLLERLQWWKTIYTPLALHVDTSAFSSFISTHTVQADTPAINAQLIIKDGTVSIVEAKPGQGQAISKADVTIPQALAFLNPQPLTLMPGEVPPAITSRDLEKAKIQVEKLLRLNVSFELQDTTIHPTPADVGSWIDITPIEAEKTVDITINDGKVASYIENATRSLVREPRSTVLLNQPEGSTTVLINGQNGVAIANKDAAAAATAKALEAGSPSTQQLQLEYQAAKTITIPQAYDKWIAVDVTNKRMYAYEKATPVRTFLISAGAPGTPTVLGQYYIYAKYPIQDMRGANTDGSRYFQANVRWVNYFYKDYAIHGNYWRPVSYFGSINSSHGCVGVLDSDAEWIYNWAPINTPVIVYD